MRRKKYIIGFLTLMALIIAFTLIRSREFPSSVLSSKEVSIYAKKADIGDKEACWNLYLHYDEVGDIEKSLYWLRKGSALGDTKAQFQIYSLLKDSSDHIKKHEAIKQLEYAANQSDSQSQLRLGQELNKGVLIARDIDSAKKWLFKASMNREIEAILDLSELILSSEKNYVYSYALTLLAQNIAKTNKGYSIRIKAITTKIIDAAKNNNINIDNMMKEAKQKETELNVFMHK